MSCSVIKNIIFNLIKKYVEENKSLKHSRERRQKLKNFKYMTNIKAKSRVWEKNAHSYFLLLVCQFCGFCTELNFGSLVQTFY